MSSKIVNRKQILIEFIILIGAFVLYGIIKNADIFKEDLGAWMIIVGASWFIATILFTLPFSPIQHSIHTITLAILLIIIGGVIHTPRDKPYISYEERYGTPQSSEWQFVIIYKKHGLSRKAIFSFTGSIEEAKEALRSTVMQWNQENPTTPATDSSKTLFRSPLTKSTLNPHSLQVFLTSFA